MLPKNRIFLEHHVVFVCQNVWVEKSKEHKIPHILSRRSLSYSTGKSSKSWGTFWNFLGCRFLFFSIGNILGILKLFCSDIRVIQLDRKLFPFPEWFLVVFCSLLSRSMLHNKSVLYRKRACDCTGGIKIPPLRSRLFSPILFAVRLLLF